MQSTLATTHTHTRKHTHACTHASKHARTHTGTRARANTHTHLSSKVPIWAVLQPSQRCSVHNTIGHSDLGQRRRVRTPRHRTHGSVTSNRLRLRHRAAARGQRSRASATPEDALCWRERPNPASHARKHGHTRAYTRTRTHTRTHAARTHARTHAAHTHTHKHTNTDTHKNTPA